MTKKLLFFTFLYKLSYSLFANESPSLKKSLIPPQSPSQDFTMKTSGVVQYHFDFYVSFTLAFPILLNQDVLQKAIALVQNDLPEFGARLILDKKLRGPALHFVGSDGIQFEFR